MLSSLKKTKDRSEGTTAPAWHPNFRIGARLPDIKPVRTVFFINGAAVLLAAALAVYAGYSELALQSLRAETISARAIAEQNKQGSAQALKQFKQFQEQEKRIVALKDFLAPGKIVLSDFILHLGKTLPTGIKLSSLDYKSNNVVLRGEIAGAADEASGIAYAYLAVMRKDAELTKLFDNITLPSLVRDTNSGVIRFEAILKFKGADAKPKGAAK